VRELHVVAVSDDGRHLLLATSPGAKQGGFQLALDDRLRAAVRGEPAARSGSATATAPVSVKQIQARLRAGESAEQIAASAGVAVDRVERFAGPVWSEREKMIQAARATRLTHSRKGTSALPLEEAVELHFAQIASLRPDSVTWSTRREDTGTWLVEVSYVARARTRSGTWRYDPAARTLGAVDTVSATLGHSETVAATAPAAPARRGKEVPKAAAPAKVPVKRVASGVKVTPGTKAPPVVAPPGATTAGKRSAAGPPALRVVPALDQQPRQPERSTTGRSTAGRASVPAWADVLLSTSPTTSPGQPGEAGATSAD
jgi:hypothetical protein